MNDWLLEWITAYGLPAFFLILMIAQIGVPMPITVMLLVLGSIIADGDLELWQVLLFGTAGAFAGDLAGYAIGKIGGRRLVRRVAERMNAHDNVKKAEDFTRKWGGAGIFLSRWLVTPLGPWLNFTSGVTEYPWRRFAFWVLVGEALWVTIYVLLGSYFSEDVQYVSELLGDMTWVLFGLFVVGTLAWQLRGFLRRGASSG